MLQPFASPQYRKRTEGGATGAECCLCGRQTSGQEGGAIFVPVNHETAEFVSDAQAEQLGEKVSLYPIGPECVKKWRASNPATTRSRIRRQRGKMICYDHRTD